jgi:hypothetical protein
MGWKGTACTLARQQATVPTCFSWWTLKSAFPLIETWGSTCARISTFPTSNRTALVVVVVVVLAALVLTGVSGKLPANSQVHMISRLEGLHVVKRTLPYSPFIFPCSSTPLDILRHMFFYATCYATCSSTPLVFPDRCRSQTPLEKSLAQTYTTRSRKCRNRSSHYRQLHSLFLRRLNLPSDGWNIPIKQAGPSCIPRPRGTTVHGELWAVVIATEHSGR